MPTQKEILQLEYDKKQTQFALDGELIINQKVIDDNTPIEALINSSNFWICPFCLETSNKFIIENKGLIKCPNCSNLMKLKTLLFVKDCSNEEYAKWVFNYRLSGFFKKINFEKWISKMKELGMSYEFWEEYKKLKGDNEKEEKEEKMYLTQEEQKMLIDALIKRINLGMTKEQIYNELSDVELNIESIDYCYNEAIGKIKYKET
jgi:hypothetical protein